MASVQAFTSVMDEFLTELREQFPNEKKLKVYQNTFTTMRKVNSRKVLDKFMGAIGPHGDKIVNRDESYFLNGNNEFLKELNIEKYWTPELSDNTKNAIWQYLNTLYVLGTTISNIPADMLKSIEGIAEQCAGNMDQTSSNGADMSNLFAGMQNMLGGLMPPNNNK